MVETHTTTVQVTQLQKDAHMKESKSNNKRSKDFVVRKRIQVPVENKHRNLLIIILTHPQSWKLKRFKLNLLKVKIGNKMVGSIPETLEQNLDKKMMVMINCNGKVIEVMLWKSSMQIFCPTNLVTAGNIQLGSISLRVE